jgi:hypothetical protein
MTPQLAGKVSTTTPSGRELPQKFDKTEEDHEQDAHCIRNNKTAIY